jgi:hypothetical protein
MTASDVLGLLGLCVRIAEKVLQYVAEAADWWDLQWANGGEMVQFEGGILKWAHGGEMQCRQHGGVACGRSCLRGGDPFCFGT